MTFRSSIKGVYFPPTLIISHLSQIVIICSLSFLYPMAAPGPGNVLARRVVDDLMAFSGQNTPSGYMIFFLEQKIAERRRFVTRMRDEADVVRGCIAEHTALVAELEAMPDQEEVHDALLAAKDAKRGEQNMLNALNDLITVALDDIATLETDAEILGVDEDEG